MRKITHYARSCALPAIAAALALSSTPLLAQNAQPVAEPIPQVTPPPPTMDATPAPEATPVDDTATTGSEPAAAAARSTAVKRTTRSTAVRSVTKPAPVHTASAQVTTRPTPAAPVASASSAPTPAPESAVTPVVDTAASAPAAPATAQAAPAPKNNSEVPVIAGGALALLALGGGAFAIARRRREDEDVWVDEQVVPEEPIDAVGPMHDEPIAEPVYDEQPKIVAPASSAFTWGNTHHSQPAMQPAASQSSTTSDDDRMPGESWVERAYRGPTPNNPSASLRNRLKRAAFFDKRDREVAAGTAHPVDMDAGLPEAMVDERERELA